jgi:hypothetical protein
MWACAEALFEIQRDKLYLEEYDYFQDFLFSEVGYSKARAYQLINAFKYREEQKRIVDKGGTATVPDTVNQAVVAQTPSAQKQAAPPQWDTANTEKTESTPVDSRPPEKNSVPVSNNGTGDTAFVDVELVESSESDRMGFPLPKEIQEGFNQWHVTQRLVKKLAEVKQYVEHAKQISNPLFAHLSNAWITSIENVIYELKSSMPYAVCPYCQGRNPLQCTNCNHTGWIGKYYYERMAASELRTMRELQISQLTSKRQHEPAQLPAGCSGGDPARV